MPSPVLPKHKDTAQGQLLSGISAAGLTITLKSSEGAEFPQPYTGTCSSTGSSTTLNDTGDLAGVAQYDYIRNVTDGSWAICLTTGTNSITTTRLRGGTLNVWTSGDEWRVGEFVITLADITTNAYGVQTINASEKALVKNRSGDVLTVATGGRGYDSSSAQTWDTDDYVNLFVASVTPEGFRGIVAELMREINTNITDIATANTDIDSIESNATFYVAAAGSSNNFTGTLSKMPAAYTTGERLFFKANHTINGSATFNRAGLGAKTLKKLDGATNLASGDIQNGQIVEIVYDGTNYLMVSPLGQVSTQLTNVGTVTAASAAVGSGSTAENTMSPTWTGSADIGSSKFAGVGSWAHIRLSGAYRLDSGGLTIKVKAGSTLLAHFEAATATTGSDAWAIDLHVICRTAGASGVLIAGGQATFGDSNYWTASADGTKAPPAATGAFDLTAAQTLTVTATYSASDADHACTIEAGSITIQNAPT